MSASLLVCLGFILVVTASASTVQSTTSNRHDQLSHPRNGSLRKYLEKLNSEQSLENDKPAVSLFYESMCPHSRTFFIKYYTELYTKLGHNIYLLSIPYGKAGTTKYYNNTITFTCQHGDAECYGNKLHTCAIIKYLTNNTMPNYTLFNACLMDFNRTKRGSDDDAVHECQSIMNIDEEKTKIITDCAKSNVANELLDIMGMMSRNANYTSVPHVEINEKPWTGKPEDLIKDVCALFTNPPETCKDV